MQTTQVHRSVTSRDIEILTALDRCPLTVEQLLYLSRTFNCQGFTSARSAQDRLAKLASAGWIHGWRYATTGRGASPHYYKPTLLGYRILYGETARPATKRQFHEVGLAHQHHTRCLSDFIVHTIVTAHTRSVRMRGFYRENTLCLTIGEDTLLPDCAFELVTGRPQQFNFLVELDNATESVRSDRDAESWQRKIELYERLQDTAFPNRFRVLIVTTRSSERLKNILDAAGHLVRNRQRSLFYGVHLEHYLKEPDSVCTACFLDHRGRRVPLLPARDFPANSPHSLQQAIQPKEPIC